MKYLTIIVVAVSVAVTATAITTASPTAQSSSDKQIVRSLGKLHRDLTSLRTYSRETSSSLDEANDYLKELPDVNGWLGTGININLREICEGIDRLVAEQTTGGGLSVSCRIQSSPNG